MLGIHTFIFPGDKSVAVKQEASKAMLSMKANHISNVTKCLL